MLKKLGLPAGRVVFVAGLILAVVHGSRTQADIPLPPNVMNPATLPEAWNVLRLTRANVSRLLEEKRLAEVPEQIALCSPALRFLVRPEIAGDKKKMIDEQTARAFRGVSTVAQACMVQSPPDAEKSFVEVKAAIAELEKMFDEKDVNAEIYYCVKHPEIVSTQAGSLCLKCSAQLRLRRIAYSFIYVTPADPTVKFTIESQSKIEAGQRADFKMHLATVKGAPVTEQDLLVVHGHPVHLIVTDAATEHCQIIHPMADAAAGDYLFSFTPHSAGPHRIWADIVPVATGLQELPFADVGGDYKPLSVADPADVLTATAEGFKFQLSFAGMSGQARARQIQLMRVEVTDADGKPVQRLEPFMNAFAHCVGIYDDHQTVMRLHPAGGDILRDDVRGGPYLGFKVYAPRTGNVRFFCMVRIDGRPVTVPFRVNILE